jgi:hypothetical protein
MILLEVSFTLLRMLFMTVIVQATEATTVNYNRNMFMVKVRLG